MGSMMWWRRPKTECGGIPIRDGLTHEEDRKRVLDMLCLCGECDGVGPRESYSSYLRRLIDALIAREKALKEIVRYTQECSEPSGWLATNVRDAAQKSITR